MCMFGIAWLYADKNRFKWVVVLGHTSDNQQTFLIGLSTMTHHPDSSYRKLPSSFNKRHSVKNISLDIRIYLQLCILHVFQI